jgi:hypothetical protein
MNTDLSNGRGPKRDLRKDRAGITSVDLDKKVNRDEKKPGSE